MRVFAQMPAGHRAELQIIQNGRIVYEVSHYMPSVADCDALASYVARAQGAHSIEKIRL
jgi:hypothetical protein